jgi:hypothetical protein
MARRCGGAVRLLTADRVLIAARAVPVGTCWGRADPTGTRPGPAAGDAGPSGRPAPAPDPPGPVPLGAVARSAAWPELPRPTPAAPTPAGPAPEGPWRADPGQDPRVRRWLPRGLSPGPAVVGPGPRSFVDDRRTEDARDRFPSACGSIRLAAPDTSSRTWRNNRSRIASAPAVGTRSGPPIAACLVSGYSGPKALAVDATERSCPCD